MLGAVEQCSISKLNVNWVGPKRVGTMQRAPFASQYHYIKPHFHITLQTKYSIHMIACIVMIHFIAFVPEKEEYLAM